MTEIKINIDELNNSISKLRSLKTKCTNADMSAPSTAGGGQVVNELEAIAGEYKKINTQFASLIQNTVSFLENVRDSYVAGDRKSADAMTEK